MVANANAVSMVQVPFHGEFLDAIQDGEKVWVSLRRCCENLGVSMQMQLAKLKSKPWATVMENITVAEDGKNRSLTMIDLDTLPGWLFSIDARKVKEQVREKLARYQREAARVLADHFFRRPTTPPINIETLRDLIRGEMTTLLRSTPQPGMVGAYQALPRFTIEERCRFKDWPHVSERQRTQIRRVANSLLDLRYGETPDCYGRVLTYYGHQLVVLDEAIDRVRQEYDERDRQAGRSLFRGV